MIIKKEWTSNTKTLLIWAGCVAILDFVMLLMFPGLKDTMGEMASMYEGLGAFGTAFGMNELNIGTADGFYGMYVGAILSVGGAMFAALLGTSMLAKEEAGHTAEYLFTLPYSRVNIVGNKILATLLLVVAFDLINLLFGIAALCIIGANYFMRELLLFHAAQLIMHIELASIGILISACTKRVNTGMGLGIALLFYFLDMMSRVLDQLSFCKYITPFYFANAADTMGKGTVNLSLLFLSVGISILCLGAGTWIYNTRDLAA